VVGVAVLAATAAVSACSSSGGTGKNSTAPVRTGAISAGALSTGSATNTAGNSPVSVDVGTSKITVTPPLNVGIYTSAATASFGVAEDNAMKSFAAKHNIKLTIFDAAFNSGLQFKQIQSAIKTKQFNVIGVLPVDGQPICKQLSEQAPAAGLLVTVFDQPLCGRFTKEGNDLWQPGTLNYISGYDTKATLQQWIDAIVAANPGPRKVAFVGGVPTDGLSQNINNILKQEQKDHPQFKVVTTQSTDYSSEQGYTKTQALLQANPDVSVVICSQSNITQGAARAIKQAGKTGKVFVADYGGDSTVVDLMKKKEVQLTGPTYPASEGVAVMQTLLDVISGKQAQRFVPVPFTVVTQKNLASYKPEY
jgi:ribose transport system substrate-binding protein